MLHEIKWNVINLQHQKSRNILYRFYSAHIANCYWLFVAFPLDYKYNSDVLQVYVIHNTYKCR